MIPKKIHYCWFGGKPIPKKFKKYINSWKKYCPDYEIIEWNESNYDVTAHPFVKAAYEAKKWGFVTDYIRLDVVEKYGGFYFDTDVELIKPIDFLRPHSGFCSFEQSGYVSFGLGFAAESHNPIIKEIRDYYNNIKFDISKTCPIIQTEVLERYGLQRNGQYQELAQSGGGKFAVYPAEYFCPMDYSLEYTALTENTVSIHHFAATWFAPFERFKFLYWNKVRRNFRKLIKMIIGKQRIKTIKYTVNTIKDCIFDRDKKGGGQ